MEYDTPGAHAISTALGYNQLLSTNSVELLAERGDRFLQLLGAKRSALHGDAKAAIDAKIAIVRQMVDFSRSVPLRLNSYSFGIGVDLSWLLRPRAH